MFDIAQQSLDLSRASHVKYAGLFQSNGRMSEREVGHVLSRIVYESDLPTASKDADIVSESVTESLEIKKSIYGALSQHCPPNTIFTTNTSTMLPSELAAFTNRPERFLACHVGRPVWDVGMLEIMPHAGTDPAVTDEVVAFTRKIGLTPIFLKKEQSGYISNSLIAPFITSALDLVSRGVALFEDVDRVWMRGTGAPIGPFGMIDLMGIRTVHQALLHLAENAGRPEFLSITTYLKADFLDHGKLGVQSGNGFYSYPDPHFSQADFL
jgi:3-hydroxybutyryl-CoA dehydrogenase